MIHKDFTVTAEGGVVFTFNFKMYNFYHLLGFHYLTDLPDIERTRRKDEVIKRFINGRIHIDYLRKSVFYPKIEKRIENFPVLEDMLINDSCKIIVDFDHSIVPSTSIKARFILYKTDDHLTYNMFGIAHSSDDQYYPETFLLNRQSIISQDSVY